MCGSVSDTHGAGGREGSALKTRYFHPFLRNIENGNSHSETAISEGQKDNMVEW